MTDPQGGAEALETTVGAHGHVFVSDPSEVSVTAPTSEDISVLDETWIDLGYVGEGGVKFKDEASKTNILAWNARRPIRRIAGDASTTLGFELLQWNSDSFLFAMGGGDLLSGAFTPNPEADDFRSLVIAWADGDNDYLLYVPKGVTSGSVELALTQSNITPLPVEFESMPDEGDDPWTLFTNADAFSDDVSA